jgi:transcriptional regulator with XRE-family HTH domain
VESEIGALIDAERSELDELETLGRYLRIARLQRDLSQSELAVRSGLSQTQISYFEAGQRLPSLDQLLRIARALDVSIQKLIGGSDRPRSDMRDIAIELRNLGVVDLWVNDARVPGAFRRAEEIAALVVAPEEPDPRILEAVPAILAWNEIDPILLQAFGIASGSRTCARLGWLADVALAIDEQGGFPGGCRKESLARFTRLVSLAETNRDAWDCLGHPKEPLPSSPLWKRWRISYDAGLDEFKERAKQLDEHRNQRSPVRSSTIARQKVGRRHGP